MLDEEKVKCVYRYAPLANKLIRSKVFHLLNLDMGGVK
jgi:hypothetical protein